jgi:hypothetical protein
MLFKTAAFDHSANPSKLISLFPATMSCGAGSAHQRRHLSWPNHGKRESAILKTTRKQTKSNPAGRLRRFSMSIFSALRRYRPRRPAAGPVTSPLTRAYPKDGMPIGKWFRDGMVANNRKYLLGKLPGAVGAVLR